MFHIVENDEQQRSLWPEFRKQALPDGWRYTGVSGSRDDCLRQIAGDAASHPAVSVSVPVAPASLTDAASRRRSIAVPFSRPQAKVRLFVFPHAGSGASSYHFLARACKNDAIEVNLIQYPGREMRIREQPCKDMRAMTQLLNEDLHSLFSERPFAFFGHSMGSLVAFELARRLAATNGPKPQHLFLSGRQAPQRPAPNLQVDSLTDEAFLDAVGRRYNALPAELISNPEILALVLPSLRADFKLMAMYDYREGMPLNAGLTLMNGVDDPWVSPDSVEAWQIQSKEPIRKHWFPGGHFYLPETVTKVRQVLLDTLAIIG
jgi:surfactin synthase thioesterase subunit